MDNIEIGTETTCYCGRTIVWLGNCWDHTGNNNRPRHPGRPPEFVEDIRVSFDDEEKEKPDYGSIYASVY